MPVDPGSDGSTELALLGAPVPGLEVSIIDPATGEPCGDRQVGELRIKDAEAFLKERGL